MKTNELFQCNAQIESAEIIIERGFVLTCWITLNYGGSCQNFGGYSLMLDKSSANHNKSKEFNYAGTFILRILEIAGVESWEELKGKTIRVRKTDEWGSIISVGHIIKEDWFNPEEEFADLMKVSDD